MTAKEFARVYGSPERAEFVKGLPCCACGRWPSDNHHTENGGMSRKAGYLTIVPLCGMCHRLLHNVGKKSFETRYGLSLPTQAKLTEMLWQRYLSQEKIAA